MRLLSILFVSLLTVVGGEARAQLPALRTGDLYVADFVNDRVAIYGPTGNYLRDVTHPALDGPRGVLFGSDDRIYVASQTNSSILVFDRSEQFVTSFTSNELAGPTGMSESPNGELYVSSFNNSRVCVFAFDGTFLRSFSAPGLRSPNCVAFDRAGNIYVASASTGTVEKFAANEVHVASFRPPAPVRLSSPMGIARDRCGVLYVAGGSSDNIVMFATDGTYLGEIRHPDLTGPQGVVFDERGHLFSSSFYQDRIVEFAADGTPVQTITAGGLRIPRSMAFAPMARAGVRAIGCGAGPAGSLTVASGPVNLGATIHVAMHNPLGTQSAAGSTAPWLLGSLRAQPGCGVPIPGFGMSGNGAPGTLLVDLSAGVYVLGQRAPIWRGAPSTSSFRLPTDCEFAGVGLTVQGILLDLAPGSTAPIALTSAVELLIGH